MISVIQFVVLQAMVCLPLATSDPDPSDPTLPGYYMFDTEPYRSPPSVPKPPYKQSDRPCPGLNSNNLIHGLSENLCGNLQLGEVPLNPMHAFNGQAYPFDLIRNKSLDFFGSTLPILKADRTLPRVARLSQPTPEMITTSNGSASSESSPRERRAADVQQPVSSSVQQTPPSRSSAGTQEEDSEDRNSRGFCDSNWGVFCSLFRGWSSSAGDSEVQKRSGSGGSVAPSVASFKNPLTPCPSTVEYVTPVFARNFEGVWRYVVQIPHEGYFTQTIEVTNCAASRCQLLEGLCLSSPRWVSLLVAELFYPHQTFPLVQGEEPRSSAQSPQQQSDRQRHLQERGDGIEGSTSGDTDTHCDGSDDLGCYQVRLYYDWFLVPGNCKCWKQDVFSQYRSIGRAAKSAIP